MSDHDTAAFAGLAALETYLEELSRTPSKEAAGLTELDHGLQCAAELEAVAPDDEELQIAGLLHDVGHGLSHIRDHAEMGGAALGAVFSPRVAQVVALHVRAKRYLVTTEPSYRARLSPTSIETLALQGGDMSAAERTAFEAEPHWREALMVRRADESAKTVGREVPGLDYWRPALARLALKA